MATHRVRGRLATVPAGGDSPRSAADLIAAFGIELPAESCETPRHGVAVPEPRRPVLGGNPSSVSRQSIYAAASATVLGATAAVVAVTGGASVTEATSQMTAVDQATQPLRLANQSAPAPVAPLASGYDAATKHLADALPAAMHRADATQIIAASRATVTRARSGGGGSAHNATPVPVVTGSGKGVAALQAAMKQIGKPYVWGAAGPSSFDCSGLVLWAYKQIGVSLPHSSSIQSTMGTPVSRDQLQPGDLVFFYSPVSHVGIYAGNGKVLNASTSGQPVQLSNLANMPFHNARRL
jgi:cell wall-associated NlpC family hydrolase